MITARLKLNTDLQFTYITAVGIPQFSNAKIVVYLPSIQIATVLYAWITPGNYKFPDRGLLRDAAEDGVEGFEGYYAYSSQIYPGMTLGLAAMQDTGNALIRIRVGNVLSPIAKITVLKAIVPEDSEMPPSQYEQLDARLDNIESELVDSFVERGLPYDAITDLDQEDKLYVERGGIAKYITAEGMLGGIEQNIDTLFFETKVSYNPSILPPDDARTWFEPVEEVVGDPMPEQPLIERATMNFDDSPEAMLSSMFQLDVDEETNTEPISDEVSLAALEVDVDTEYTVGTSNNEVNIATYGIETDTEIIH